ncbi:MAG: right-handed parallel beta-helix repeat-containing protein [Planctomycetota bacterium]|nr:MAG: right-handed parallel beta-helix repeat-containing protein [Planctomycetota bacterium]
MQLSIRLGRTCVEILSGLLLISMVISAQSAGAHGPSTHLNSDQNKILRIIVNSKLGRVSDNPTVITLADALAQAANDSGINVIEFDPLVFRNRPAIIKFVEPIVVEGNIAGHDRIDGGNAKVPIILDMSGCNDAGIVVAGQQHLTLSRLTVRGGRQRAILVKAHGQVNLEHVTVCDAGGPGLALFDEARASIQVSKFTSNRTHGLELHGESNVLLNNVDLLSNGQSGIAEFDRSSVLAVGCRFDANGQWDVVLAEDSRAQLTDCLLRSSQFAGVDVCGSASLRLEDCRIEKGRRFGVFATGQANIELSKTHIQGHGSRAIELQDRAVLKLSESRIENNDDYGVILFGESQIDAVKTVVVGNAAHGISLRNRSSGRFVECLFAGNRYSGIGCLDADEGGEVSATRCLFRQNGMRPIYRGPLHINPLVPTPLRINGTMVICRADIGAAIELYLDRAGEAAGYLKTVRADGQGEFRIDCRDVPAGLVMTAAATVNGSTSEFNVVAGNSTGPVVGALLGKTGRLSDEGGEANLDVLLRRWKPGTHIIFNVTSIPSTDVERYMRYLIERINDWTAGSITAEIRFGKLQKNPQGSVIIPIQYLSADSPQLMGRGGVTYMRWDAAGFFMRPMEIMLAVSADRGDVCPRVFAHEVGHTLGLSHARVGLLSRMQGSIASDEKFVNDFSPMLTYYDVLALQILYGPRNKLRTTLRDLVEQGAIAYGRVTKVATVENESTQSVFGSATDEAAAPKSGN